MRRVAEAVEGPADGREARLAGLPGDLGHGAAEVQPDLVDAGEGGGEPLHEPDAGGAVDPLEVEPGPAAAGARGLGRLLLEALVVEVLEAAPGDPRRLEDAVLLVDEAVVLVEPPLVHEGVDLPAAGAAELLFLALADEAGRDREAAVRARHRGGVEVPALAGTGHFDGPSAGAGSASTVMRAAWTKRRASRVVSMRSSQAPGSSRRTSDR